MSRQNDEHKYRSRSGKGGTSERRPNGRATWFFPVTPTKEQRDEIRVLLQQANNEWFDLLVVAVEHGYRLSLKWHVPSNAFQATLTGDAEHEFNPERCLAAYHGNAWTALAILAYFTERTFPHDQVWTKAQSGFDIDW